MSEMKTYQIKLIKQTHLMNEYYQFDFEKPEGFEFENGQYAIFAHVNKEVEGRKVRAFSIASSVEEDFIRVATRIVDKPSDFKQKLKDLKPGDVIQFNAPVGDFTLEKDTNHVFVAGGIGITPIRSMLLDIKLKQSNDALLLYSEINEAYPFLEEFKALENLDIKLAHDIEPTQKIIKEAAEQYQNNAVYYLAGSPSFVSGISGQLISLGIDQSHIKFDKFTGY
jgi:ferredoxin-NADP reductase